jgi:hypothetical protein
MAELVLKQITGDISEEEIIELNQIGSTLGLDPKQFDELQDITVLEARLKLIDNYDVKASWKRLEAAYSFTPVKKTWEYIKMAAVVIPVVTATLTWILIHRAGHSQLRQPKNITCKTSTINDNIYPWSLKTTKNNTQSFYWGRFARQNEPITTMKSLSKSRSKVRQPSERKVPEKKSDITMDITIHFENSDLQTIMRKLGIGKDYEVQYAGAGQPETYTGIMPRGTSMETFMQYMQLQYDYAVAVEGKKISIPFGF